MASVGYFFHGYAGDQILGDPKFYDISGCGNHGSFGAHLSNANAWANAGYVSTLNPVGGSTDSVIRIPGFNFDYAGGEKMFGWWLGKLGAEAAGVSFMGDGFSTTYPGFRFRINANTTGQVTLSSTATTIFSENGEAPMADGTLHSFAWVIDGANRSYGVWTDEIFEHSLFSRYVPFGVALPGPGPSVDTRNNNTFNIGTCAPKLALSTDGIASQTRALAILRFGATEAVPSVPHMTEICKALRVAPWQLIQPRALQ